MTNPTPGIGSAAWPHNSSAAPTTAQRSTSGPLSWHRSQLAYLTVAVSAVYLLIAEFSHLVVVGIVPLLLAVRSARGKEPLWPVAAIAAVAAIAVGVRILAG